MSLEEKMSLNEIKERMIFLLQSQVQDKELLELVIKQYLAKAVIETKELCLAAVLKCENECGDNTVILEAIDDAIPTSSVSTDLIT